MNFYCLLHRLSLREPLVITKSRVSNIKREPQSPSSQTARARARALTSKPSTSSFAVSVIFHEELLGCPRIDFWVRTTSRIGQAPKTPWRPLSVRSRHGCFTTPKSLPLNQATPTTQTNPRTQSSVTSYNTHQKRAADHLLPRSPVLHFYALQLSEARNAKLAFQPKAIA